MGINIRYIVIKFFRVKSQDVFEGAYIKLYGISHGGFFHMDE